MITALDLITQNILLHHSLTTDPITKPSDAEISDSEGGTMYGEEDNGVAIVNDGGDSGKDECFDVADTEMGRASTMLGDSGTKDGGHKSV